MHTSRHHWKKIQEHFQGDLNDLNTYDDHLIKKAQICG